MSLKKIAALCKSRHKANLWNVADKEGCVSQWIFCRDAAYPCGNVPFFEQRHIPALLSLSEKDLEKVVIGDEPKPESIDLSDYSEGEVFGVSSDVYIEFGGTNVLPVLFGGMSYFIDADLLKPISARCKEPSFYLRNASDTMPYIAVKNGMLLVWIIFPMTQLDTLVGGMRKIIDGYQKLEE